MRGRWLLVGAALAAASLAWWMAGRRPPLQRGQARRVWSGVSGEAWEVQLRRGGARVGRLVSVHLETQRVRPRLVLNRERAALADLAPEADLVANAGFFTPEFRPTGLLVSEGQVLHPFVDHGGAAGTGVIVWRRDGEVSLVPRAAFALDRPDAVRIAIQAGPRLIEPDGRPGIRSDDRLGANRTVVGRDGRGRFVIVVAQAPTSGPSLWEMMELVGEGGLGAVHDELALEFALNLDGGPSSGLQLRTADLSLPEAAAVPSALTVELDR